ncbi:MAG: hypothetical protein HYU39_07405 [Thaumarchaeota archaeon]|nr:hypothetical protein [Nitrososphaerota archaeon]
MCTLIGLLNPDASTKILFAENRDRPIESFWGNDVRVVDDHVVAIYDFRSEGIVCGYSTKTGLFGGLTNVYGVDAPRSRGVLMRQILGNAGTLKEAENMMIEKVKQGLYRPANYVLGDSESIVRIESFGNKHSVEEGFSKVIVTNHFHRIHGGRAAKGSVNRERFVTHNLRKERTVTVETLANLMTHHDPETGICKHGRTLASMILRVPTKTQPEILYSIGPPCKGYTQKTLADPMPTLTSARSPI